MSCFILDRFVTFPPPQPHQAFTNLETTNLRLETSAHERLCLPTRLDGQNLRETNIVTGPLSTVVSGRPQICDKTLVLDPNASFDRRGLAYSR